MSQTEICSNTCSHHDDDDCTRHICSDCHQEFSCGNKDHDGNWFCEECGGEEYTEEELWFNENYPNACCLRCSVALDGKTVVYCRHDEYGMCETWYCDACHEEGTDDCPIYLDEKQEGEENKK